MMERVFIATRGEIASRLVAWFKAQDPPVETVTMFSEVDAEQPWVDEADYSVYVPGQTVEETYANPSRVIGAAMDAGCDVIHPGYCFLAKHLGFFQAAANANIAVIGTSIPRLAAALNRGHIDAVCDKYGIDRIPSTADLSETDDGIAEAAQLGFPLYVKASSGGKRIRVDRMEGLAAAIADVRIVAEATTGNPAVYFQRVVDDMRTLATVVVADQHGACEALGHVDSSLRMNYRSWVESIGEGVVSRELAATLITQAKGFTTGLNWAGLGRITWAITPRGGVYLLQFSPRMSVGYSLFEQALGVDLIRTQIRVQSGQHLDWEHADTTPTEHFLQIRVMHMDPVSGERPEGKITRFDVPEGVMVESGTDIDQPANSLTDPLLCKITVSAPTRQAALVKAHSALENLHIEGITTNRDFLMQLLSDPEVWGGRLDTRTLSRMIAQRQHPH
ncbi:MAG: acetyl/propionyl-CoA carboxylase alpha subunit [Myxococcota bacterium]|jgi:acetyl/propionyl-CoA carboxylase alpha subunit